MIRARTSQTATAMDQNASTQALVRLIAGRLQGDPKPIARAASQIIIKMNPPAVLTLQQQSILLLDAAKHGNSFDVDLALRVATDERVWGIQDQNGDTALAIIWQRLPPEVVIRCLKKGADPGIRTKDGKSPALLFLRSYERASGPSKRPLPQHLKTMRTFVKWGVHIDFSWLETEPERFAVLAGERDLRAAVKEAITDAAGLLPDLSAIVVSYAFAAVKRRRVCVLMERVLRAFGVSSASGPARKRAKKSLVCHGPSPANVDMKQHSGCHGGGGDDVVSAAVGAFSSGTRSADSLTSNDDSFTNRTRSCFAAAAAASESELDASEPNAGTASQAVLGNATETARSTGHRDAM